MVEDEQDFESVPLDQIQSPQPVVISAADSVPRGHVISDAYTGAPHQGGEAPLQHQGGAPPAAETQSVQSPLINNSVSTAAAEPSSQENQDSPQALECFSSH